MTALAAGLPQGALLYRWDPATTGENPYLGLLAHADRFVVTGDSISMMVEVASLGKPLAIFALPVGNGLADRLRAALGACSRRHRWAGSRTCCIAWVSPATPAISARSGAC